MKKFAKILIVYISLFSCKKTETTLNDNFKTAKLEVVEYKTNMPIANANMEFYKPVLDLDPCFCSSYELLFTRQTNEYGIIELKDSVINKAVAIVIKKEGYFRYWYKIKFSGLSDSRFELDPIAKINLHLVKTGSYNSDAWISISDSSEHSTSNENLVNTSILRSGDYPAEGFANQTNTFTWTVHNTYEIYAKGTVRKEIAKDGITDVLIQY